jgi:hypothetical protein
MFTWICPQCGREVPPSYTECPDCEERAKKAPVPPPQQQQPPQHYPPPPAAEAPPPQYYAPPQQQYAPPPPPPQQQYAPPPQQQYAPPQQYGQPPQPYGQQYYQHPPHQKGMMNMPIWLMTILFALTIGGVVGGVVWMLSSNRGSAGTGPSPSAVVESPAAKPGSKTNPLQKHIEISGVRFVQDARKKTMVRFLIVNHSESEISGLTGNVTVWGRTQKSEEDAQGTFNFNTSLAPFDSKELTVPFNTKLKIYELPDWQNITTDIQITAPAA